MKTQVITAKSKFLLRLWTALVSLQGHKYLEVFHTLWICEQSDTKKADNTLVGTPKTLTHCPSLLKRRQSGMPHPFGTTLSEQLGKYKISEVPETLLGCTGRTKTKLSIFRPYLAGKKAKGVNRCLFALKVIFGLCSLVTIMGCVYRQSPKHAAVICFWICHMGSQVDRAIDYVNKLSRCSYVFSSPCKDILQNSLVSAMLFSLEIFLISNHV